MLWQKLKTKEERIKKEDSFIVNGLSETLVLQKPNVKGTRKNRKNKSEVYKLAKNVLCNISLKGNYIGLGAAFIPEIYDTLSPQIEGLVLNCENDSKSAHKLRSYTKLIRKTYRKLNKKTDFALYEGDIFEAMKYLPHKFSIVDLDLMEYLGTTKKGYKPKKVERIVKSLKVCTTNKSALILWSLYGKCNWECQYDEEFRPKLLRQIASDFKILDIYSYKYRDNYIPVKVELLVLQKRKRKKNHDINF